MTKRLCATSHPQSLRSERNLALIFGLLALLLTALIALHWFLVLEPTLRMEAESQSIALAAAHIKGIEKLFGNGFSPKQLKAELQTAFDDMLLLKGRPTGAPFIRKIDLTFDADLYDMPPGSLDVHLGEASCADCFVATIPLYDPHQHLLVAVAKIYSSPWFFEHLAKDVWGKLLWVGAIILCLIAVAWLESSRLLHRLSDSEANLRHLFEAAPFPMMLHESQQFGLYQANQAAKDYLGLTEDAQGYLSSEGWRAIQTTGLSDPDTAPREISVPTLDGTPRCALISLIPLRFSGKPSRLISLVDVSEMKRIQDELLTASLTDGLTGLRNRRYLFQRLTKEIELVNRYDHPLSIVLFDLDHFKSVNDTYGHRAGDEVLIRAATTLASCIRDVDVAGRYGGEEFLLILPHSSASDAIEVAERIRLTIKGLAWPQPKLRVTVSGGVCEYHGESLDEFVEAADSHLYAAKEAGRDRIVA